MQTWGRMKGTTLPEMDGSSQTNFEYCSCMKLKGVYEGQGKNVYKDKSTHIDMGI